MEAYTCDRSKWARGPWDGEPEDRVEWRSGALSCLLLRGPQGAWCGYVAVPPGHPWHGATFYDGCSGDERLAGVEVHHGLTYSRGCAGHICHVPAPGEPDDVWWLGFDCAHASDAVPAWGARGRGEVYRTRDWARAETGRLARQVHAAGVA